MIKLFKTQIFTLFFILLFSSNATFAISFFGDDEDVIWKSGLNRYFKYVKQDRSTAGTNDHPVKLDAMDISTALKALQFGEKSFLRGEEIRYVFSIPQITLLGKQLAKGLKNAKPGQDIIFVMEGGQSKLVLLTQKTFVAGRVFYKDGKLNIILGEYDLARNAAFESVYDPSGRGAIPYTFYHCKRSKESKKFDGRLEDAPGIENKKLGKKFRKDWFVIDVEIASKAYLAQLKESKNPSSFKDDKRLQLEAAKLSRERRQMRAEMARMRKEMKELSSAPASIKSPEERFVILEQLRKKELITQEEYESRRQEILNDI